jgi:transposase
LCKLAAVVSKLAGHQTARAVVEAMIAGERDPRVLAALGRGRMRNEKLPALAEALSGMRSGPQHAHAAASLLRATGLLDAELRELHERVTEHLAAIPASWGVDCDGVTGPQAGRAGGAAVLPAADRLDEIPGLGKKAAAALIAEIGLDMSRFPTPQALVSWAGLTPTARQSGPRKGRGKKGHGNTYAKRIAVLAAYAAANTGTFPGERFRRLASRPGAGGRKKAGCAVGRSILIIVWHLLNDRAARYQDPGSGWHARHTDRSRKARNARRQLEGPRLRRHHHPPGGRRLTREPATTA